VLGNEAYIKKDFSKAIFHYENASKYDPSQIIYLTNGKKFLLRHFYVQVLNRKNPSFIRASLLSEEYFISPRFYLLEFKITSNLEKYFCGFIHV
jgi:hypothetical protein